MKEKMLLWTPRVLAILAILFLMLFSIDCFEPGQSLRNQMTCFVMHNIPAFVVILVLVISWRWKLIGGVLFIAAAITGVILFNGFGGNYGIIILMLPFVATGALLIVYFYTYPRAGKHQHD